MIRLLLADDQALFRTALSSLLSLERDFSVVSTVGRGDEVLPAVREHRPDVALLDIEMPGSTGIEACAEITAELADVRVLILTTFERPGYLRRAIDAGAAGFVAKHAEPAELAEAIRKVHAGYRVIDSDLAHASLFTGSSPLTPREQDVLRASLDGRPVRAIAAELHLSAGTVRNHLSSAIAKTQTHNRAAAARTAMENGWL